MCRNDGDDCCGDDGQHPHSRHPSATQGRPSRGVLLRGGNRSLAQLILLNPKVLCFTCSLKTLKNSKGWSSTGRGASEHSVRVRREPSLHRIRVSGGVSDCQGMGSRQMETCKLWERMSSPHVNFDKSMIGFTSESLPVDICNPERTSAGGQATSDDVFVGRLRGLHVRLLRVTTMHGQTLSNPLGLNTSEGASRTEFLSAENSYESRKMRTRIHFVVIAKSLFVISHSRLSLLLLLSVCLPSWSCCLSTSISLSLSLSPFPSLGQWLFFSPSVRSLCPSVRRSVYLSFCNYSGILFRYIYLDLFIRFL